MSNMKGVIVNAMKQAAEHGKVHDMVTDFVLAELQKINVNNDPIAKEYLLDMFIRISEAIKSAKCDYNSAITSKVTRVVADAIALHNRLHTELNTKHEMENLAAAFGGSDDENKH